MDRYLVIDTQELEIISTNEITFADTNDGCSVKCDKKADFNVECRQALEDTLKALERL